MRQDVCEPCAPTSNINKHDIATSDLGDGFIERCIRLRPRRLWAIMHRRTAAGTTTSNGIAPTTAVARAAMPRRHHGWRGGPCEQDDAGNGATRPCMSTDTGGCKGGTRWVRLNSHQRPWRDPRKPQGECGPTAPTSNINERTAATSDLCDGCRGRRRGPHNRGGSPATATPASLSSPPLPLVLLSRRPALPILLALVSAEARLPHPPRSCLSRRESQWRAASGLEAPRGSRARSAARAV